LNHRASLGGEVLDITGGREKAEMLSTFKLQKQITWLKIASRKGLATVISIYEGEKCNPEESSADVVKGETL
jgi:hypothetical protein